MAADDPLAEREPTIDRLCEAFAEDRMGLDEFERRVALAHAASSSDELSALLSDLPPPARGRAPAARTTPERSGTSPMMRERSRRVTEDPADQNIVLGFLGGGGRRGPWTAGRTNWAIAVMGGVELDLREAILPAGVTEVKVFAFWGGVQVVVPPDVRVECSGVGIMGGFDHEQTARSTEDPDAPLVRVGGWALMGGIEVVVRHPGESARDARRRRRDERRALRAARVPRPELRDRSEG